MTVMAQSAYEKVRDALAPSLATLATPKLCELLLILDGKGDLDEHERIVRSLMEEELCNRHPEVDAASLAWSEDVECADTRSHAEVIAAAALAATEGR